LDRRPGASRRERMAGRGRQIGGSAVALSAQHRLPSGFFLCLGVSVAIPSFVFLSPPAPPFGESASQMSPPSRTPFRERRWSLASETWGFTNETASAGVPSNSTFAPQWRGVMQKRSFLLFIFVISAVILGVSVAPACAAAAPADTVSYFRIVRLSYVSGDVQIVRADQSDKWQAAYANMPIQQGFTLGTNDGGAEVEFESGSALWLAEKSMLQFTELALSDGGRITK